jgi:D-proline reductase (dithiol) PrdB
LIRGEIPEKPLVEQIPWTPLNKPIQEATFSLMTSAGISMRTDPPFDMEREKREPSWGDPSFREIPKEATEADINVNHLHIKTDYIKEDINVILPLTRFRELENERIIGRLAPTCYSYYGFQQDPTILLEQSMPKVARKMKEEGVEAILLTPA